MALSSTCLPFYILITSLPTISMWGLNIQLVLRTDLIVILSPWQFILHFLFLPHFISTLSEFTTFFILLSWMYHQHCISLFKNLAENRCCTSITAFSFCYDWIVWTASFGNFLKSSFPLLYVFNFLKLNTQSSGLLVFIIIVEISISHFPDPRSSVREQLFPWRPLKQNSHITHNQAQGCVPYCGPPNQLFLHFLQEPLIVSKNYLLHVRIWHLSSLSESN